MFIFDPYVTITTMPQVLTGFAKGRRLKVPRGLTVRPTTSRIKTSIFDTLGDIKGFDILDLFAGSGGLGIEALSRGAARSTFVEKNPQVIKILRENLINFDMEMSSELQCSNYLMAVKRLNKQSKIFDIIFIDPPYPLYNRKTVEEIISPALGLLAPGGKIIIEHNVKLDEVPDGVSIVTKSFGETHVSFITRGGL